MNIGIICALDTELKQYLENINHVITTKHARLSFHQGKLGRHNVTAMYCGICKVNAALATQILIDKYAVDCVIVSGVAGGIDRTLRIGDTVISTQVAYHDVADGLLKEYHPHIEDSYFPVDEKLLETCRKVASANNLSQKIYFGRIVTGETFIEEEGRNEIIDRFQPLCVDMETAAIGHVCYVNNIPFIAVRSISDTEDQSGYDSFVENCAKAAASSFRFTMEIFNTL